MRQLTLSLALLFASQIGYAADDFQFEDEQPQMTEAQLQQAYQEWADDFNASLDRKTGEVQLPGGIAKLTIPSNFYYLSPEDTSRVLTEAWQNPPSAPTLGMLFPAQYSPLDDVSWGVTVEYVEEGHVKDEDASEIDYDVMLDDLIATTAEESKTREEMGYGSIALVGWAASPYYDTVNKKLHWAQELQFEGAETNTLNYNLRVLGREGYLRLNFIAGMSQLREIENNLDAVMDMTEFNPGHTYAEFNESTDKVAAYGIGALVAGGILAKKGFFAVMAVMLLKFWKFILIGVVAVGAFAGKFGSRKKAQ